MIGPNLLCSLINHFLHHIIMQKNLQCPHFFFQSLQMFLCLECLSLACPQHASNFTSNIGASGLVFLHSQSQQLSSLPFVQPLTCDFT